MNRREAEELLKKLLSEKCSLEIERKDKRTLFYCKGELVGSAVELDKEVLALSVYGKSLSDPIHKEFLSTAKESFKDKLIKEGTRESSGFEESFHYSFVNVKL